MADDVQKYATKWKRFAFDCSKTSALERDSFLEMIQVPYELQKEVIERCETYLMNQNTTSILIEQTMEQKEQKMEPRKEQKMEPRKEQKMELRKEQQMEQTKQKMEKIEQTRKRKASGARVETRQTKRVLTQGKSNTSFRHGLILATECGTGKTFMALKLAIRLAFQDNAQPVAIIVKNQLLYHWEAQVKKHVNSRSSRYADFIHIVRNHEEFQLHLQSQINAKPIPRIYIASLEQVACTETFLNIEWELVIIEEAHTYHMSTSYYRTLFASHQLRCKHLLLVTATPETNSATLANMFGFTKHCDPFALCASYAPSIMKLPMKKREIVCRNIFLSHRTLCGYNMPQEKHETLQSNAIVATLGIQRARMALDRFVFRPKTAILLWRSLLCLESLETSSDIHTQTLQVRAHAGTLPTAHCPQHIRYDPTDVCSICQETFRENAQVVSCGHVFCETCIVAWFHVSSRPITKGWIGECPVCKSPLTSTQKTKGPTRWHLSTILPLSQQQQTKQQQTRQVNEECNVRRVLLQKKVEIFLKKFPTDQLIIFTQLWDIADGLQSILDSCAIAGFKRHRLSGEDVARITQFKERQFRILILDITEHAFGHDFPDVHHAIISDFDSLVHLHQAVHRIGSMRGLHSNEKTHVELLFHQNSIEHFIRDKLLMNKDVREINVRSHAMWFQLEWAMLHTIPETRMFALDQYRRKQRFILANFIGGKKPKVIFDTQEEKNCHTCASCICPTCCCTRTKDYMNLGKFYQPAKSNVKREDLSIY